MRENEGRDLEGRPTVPNCQVRATIYLPHGQNADIGRVLSSILDALLASGVVEDERHIDVVFIRVARGAKESAVEVSAIPPRTAVRCEKRSCARAHARSK